MTEDMGERAGPIFRDIRRYYCDFCGICRSKKSLISSHILALHKGEMEMEKENDKGSADLDERSEEKKLNTCEECGATFKKPAYLKQHMQSHSLERPFICSVEDCHASYRRKDHLARHLLKHEGKVFTCPVDGCNRSFAYQGNMKRHLKEMHDDESTSTIRGSPKQHVCPEVGCGKVFRFASRLRKHEDSHVKLEMTEAFCCDCMKSLSNVGCLKAHILSSHQYMDCEICGTKQLRKNIKRHLRSHEAKSSRDLELIQCHFTHCQRTFSTQSNLRTHVKAVHLKLKPFACCYPGCGKRFSHKHVRDNHEKTGCHVYTPGDFVELDGQFQSRPRGGRKRKCPTIESLLRKRVTLPSELDFLSD